MLPASRLRLGFGLGVLAAASVSAAAAATAATTLSLSPRAMASSGSAAARGRGKAPPFPPVVRVRGGVAAVAGATSKETTKATGLVVLVHGLGDSAHGWTDVAEQMSRALPHVAFVLPTASEMPVTLNGGMVMPAWYDIVGLDDRALETCDGIEDARAFVTRIAEEEGLPWNRVVLGGFSQGGALSVYTGMQHTHTLAGVVCMSGYLPNASNFRLSEEAKKTPVLVAHGTHDDVVRYAFGKATAEELKRRGVADVDFRTYRGMAHSVVPEELRDVLAFLRRVLPATPHSSTERETL